MTELFLICWMIAAMPDSGMFVTTVPAVYDVKTLRVFQNESRIECTTYKTAKDVKDALQQEQLGRTFLAAYDLRKVAPLKVTIKTRERKEPETVIREWTERVVEVE